MKTLNDYLNESVMMEELENIVETPEECPTLFDCMKHHIKNFGFKRYVLGPSNFERVTNIAKAIKKKYKPEEIKSVTGKKPAPAILANIVFGIARAIDVNYDLPVKERIEDISNKFHELYKEVYDATENAGSVSFYFDSDPVICRRGDYKYFVTKSGVALEIKINYFNENEDILGYMTINIDGNSPLFM